jgi:hypothetical protein
VNEPTLYGWRASITHDWAARGNRLHLFQRSGQELLLVTGFDFAGNPEMETHPVGTQPEYRGIFLPDDSLDAIAQVLEPQPGTAELKLLRQTLDLERSRVEKVLDKFLNS